MSAVSEGFYAGPDLLLCYLFPQMVTQHTFRNPLAALTQRL